MITADVWIGVEKIFLAKSVKRKPKTKRRRRIEEVEEEILKTVNLN